MRGPCSVRRILLSITHNSAGGILRDPAVLVGVVSDTHGHIANAKAAVRMLEGLDVAVVLHCGDIGTSAIPPLFSLWPTHFVLGNVDHDAAGLKSAVPANGTFHDRFADLTLLQRRIAVVHSDHFKLFRSAIGSG